jgi:hypothetical protein
MKSDKNIHATPPNLKRGQTVTAKFLMRKSPALFYQVSIFLRNVKIAGDIKGSVTFEISFRVTGDITYPVF